MNGKELAGQMKEMIKELKSEGAISINCEDLIGYLDEVEHLPNAELSTADIERYKAELQNWVESGKQAHDERKEMFKSIIAYGQGAIKSLFLLNAGAVVVMLTFVTHLAKSDLKVTEFVNSIWWFAIGVFAAALVAVLAYVCQLLYNWQNTWPFKIGIAFHILCFLAATASLWFFWEGLTSTFRAFEAFSIR
jgi:hypothetical protein